ncbi:hypothetical protein TNCV_4750691 [Trichonephila clavipes]|nr:hypothetical protein TNCV_4750691 [Trichonephila clavipes]
MDSLGHSSFPPTALGRQDDEETTPGVEYRCLKAPSTHRKERMPIKGYQMCARKKNLEETKVGIFVQSVPTTQHFALIFTLTLSCQVIYSQFGLAINPNDHQARRRFIEWAQNEIAVVPDFHKRILFSDEAHFWLNGYVNKQNCRIWRKANPQVYIKTPLHPDNY